MANAPQVIARRRAPSKKKGSVPRPVTPKKLVRKAILEAFCPPPDAPKSVKQNAFAARLEAARTKVALTQKKIADTVGLQRTAVTQWENYKSMPDIATVAAIADEINKAGGDITPEWLAFGTQPSAPVYKLPDHLVSVPEVTFLKAPGKHEEVRTWALPYDWLRHELGIPITDRDAPGLLIYKVEVDSAGYEYGDYVIVDTHTTRVQPAGTFLHWVADGPAVSRISVLPSGDRKAVAKVEGTTGAAEVPVERLTVIGRIRGIWRKA